MNRALPGVVVVDCVEYGTVEVDARKWLRDGFVVDFNPEIDGKDILRVSLSKRVLRLQATSFVGIIPLNDRVVVRVSPRVPLANLTRMVVDTNADPLPLSAFRDYTGRGTVEDWTLDLYTDALLKHVDDVLDRGLWRSYERFQDEGRYPRGRIELGQTVQRFAARGVPNKASFSWHERVVDNAPNRCIKTALEVIHTHLIRHRAQPRRGDRAKLNRLAGQFHALDEVSDDPEQWFLEDPYVNGDMPLPDPRSYYRPVLDLARQVVRGVGIALEIGGEDVQMGSLLIDTNKLFENFVRVSLSKEAVERDWPVSVLDGNTASASVPLYAVPESPPAVLGVPMAAVAERDPGRAQPDVILTTIEGEVRMVAEVKNTIHGMKGVRDNLPERSEVEQAVTYALRFDLKIALLIHPWFRGTKGLVYVGRIRDIDVYDYRLDLSVDEAIDDAIREMADAVGRLAGLEAIPTLS